MQTGCTRCVHRGTLCFSINNTIDFYDFRLYQASFWSSKHDVRWRWKDTATKAERCAAMVVDTSTSFCIEYRSLIAYRKLRYRYWLWWRYPQLWTFVDHCSSMRTYFRIISEWSNQHAALAILATHRPIHVAPVLRMPRQRLQPYGCWWIGYQIPTIIDR